MHDINYDGDILIEAENYNGDYDNLFKNLRKAIKERGVLGGLGQATGLSTQAGAERRKAKREARAQRKADRNERKNLMADAKANLKNAKAEEKTASADASRVQADALAAIPDDVVATPATEPKADNTLLFVGIGIAVCMVIGLVLFLALRKKPNAYNYVQMR
ncbi:MAG: hypothetical protein NVV82_00210 [Sporocytophaga sp.]|nr:hypothetical protein [Sporocytophaga sp.]